MRQPSAHIGYSRLCPLTIPARLVADDLRQRRHQPSFPPCQIVLRGDLSAGSGIQNVALIAHEIQSLAQRAAKCWNAVLSVDVFARCLSELKAPLAIGEKCGDLARELLGFVGDDYLHAVLETQSLCSNGC